MATTPAAVQSRVFRPVLLRAPEFRSNSAPSPSAVRRISNNCGAGNLYNGREASGRLDYNISAKDRLFAQFAWNRLPDKFRISQHRATAHGRGVGFLNPVLIRNPNGQISLIHTFSPSVLNEFRAGYAGNLSPDVSTALPGVPDIRFDDGSMGFGSYSGYPQTFHENIYSYSDMVSISHGNHNMKVGVDFRRNIENSEFSVARPSYYFTDNLFFAADSPYTMAAGVDPGILTNQPAHLASNIRHWRNLEMGAFFQDDWKITRRLTLNLGMRYDLYGRHTELNNQVTTLSRAQAAALSTTSPPAPVRSRTPACLAPIRKPNWQAFAVREGSPPPRVWARVITITLDPGSVSPGTCLETRRHLFGAASACPTKGPYITRCRTRAGTCPYYSFNLATNFLARRREHGHLRAVHLHPDLRTRIRQRRRPSPVRPPIRTRERARKASVILTGWDASNANLGYLHGNRLPGRHSRSLRL